MAHYGNTRPGGRGYDDDDDYDEFDGFAFGDSQYDYAAVVDEDFIPTVSSLVNKGKASSDDRPDNMTPPENTVEFEPTTPDTNHKSPSQANTSGGSVKFSLDSFAKHSDDVTVANSNVEESPITLASPIVRENHHRFGRAPSSPITQGGRRRYQHGPKSIGRRGQRSVLDPDERSKGQLGLAEDGENLRIALEKGNVSQVKQILENGFDPNSMLSSGWTALMHASDLANVEITVLLLDHGANPRTKKDQYSALMALCAGKKESKGRVETARVLINRGAVVNSHDRHRMSPLLYACRGCHLGLVELLLSVNADVNKQDSRGWTPLHYAASQGNHQLVKLLLESNANPKITCNLGDTPASVALSNNHTALCDWLENITSSSGGPGLAQASLLPNPLFSSETQDSNSSPRASSNDITMTSSSTLPTRHESGTSGDGVQFGDLEVFLMGEGLGKLIPLFQEHKVEFSGLLSMTDRELEMMGISEVGTRKKILGSVAEIHKKEWHMPTNALPHNRALSATEAAVILSNLSRHSTYLKATTSHLLSHVRTNMDMIGPHLLPNEIERLNSDLSGAVSAVSSLQEEMLTLQSELKSSLSQATPPSTTDDSIPLKRSRAVLLVKVIGGVVLVSGLVYVTGKTIFRYISS